jgi:D-xylose 1-dehydrogenase (NADP+, D-xylono-1,5-lactone-forming)
MRAVAWGLLSTARINGQMLAAARTSALADVVAVASRAPERAAAYAEHHGIARAHGSYQALLEDPGVEAVYVSLPNALHAEWTIRALEAGKHVLCEKPLAGSAAEVEAMFDAAERADRRLAEAFMFRHHPQTRRLAEVVHGGAIGRLQLVRATLSFAIANSADPRLRKALGGGALMDVGCYCVSAARLLAGEPEQVVAEQVLGGDGVDLRFAGTMRFAGGVLAQLDCAMDQPRRDELEVVGREGTVRLADPWHCRAGAFTLQRDYVVERVTFARRNPYRLELEAVCRSIRSGDAPGAGRHESVAQARALAALRRAASSGRAVALPAPPSDPRGGT